MQFKPKTIFVRLAFNLAILYALFNNSELMEDVCGSFTTPIQQKYHLFTSIVLIEIFRITYSALAGYVLQIPRVKKITYGVDYLITINYLFVLFFKFIFLFDLEHRKRFYLHSFLLELSIIISAVFFDFFKKNNIKQVGELLIIEGFYRLALVYELTQTFCPNLILYYSITNLLVFVLSQIEAQQRFGLNQSLYVKNDIYRFLFLSLIFYGTIAVTQLTSYGFKTFIAFILSFKWFLAALTNYNENKFKQASFNLTLTGVIIVVVEIAYIFISQLGYFDERVIDL